MLFFAMTSFTQNHIIPLWESEIPNYLDAGIQEQVDTGDIIRISKIQNPHIEVFLPAKSNAIGTGVVIFPGGGYMMLAYDWEGTDIAKMLNAKGIAAFVVKNRLPDEETSKVRHLSPILDARRAIRLVRHHSDVFNIDKNKVGVMGFSAGGHLASTLSTHYDKNIASLEDAISKEMARPDFSILVYPVISMDSSFTHQGSKDALLGKNPDQELEDLYSNEKQITKDTPPTILIHSADDFAVPVKNSLVYYEALLKNGVSAEMHLYPSGGHGYSLATKSQHLRSWSDRVLEWIEIIVNQK